VRRTRQRLARLDTRLLAQAISGRTPVLDRVMTTASTLANRSRLWLAIAALLSATGRGRPRRAAASGLLGIGVAATLVNGPLKFAWRRDRPPTTRGKEPLLPLPRTFSFPSGHSASALAFATGASVAMPVAAPALVPLASTVAYSRVHTGVHYPSDVAVGAATGVVSGLIGAHIVKRVRESSMHHVDGPALDIAVPRDAVLVTSKDAGSADGLSAARRALEKSGWRIQAVLPVEEIGEPAAWPGRDGSASLVIVAGGDGTVGAVADAITGSDALLAIIPLGTSNDIARSLGIPTDPVEAAGALAAGRVCAIDAVRVRPAGVQDRVFLNAATAGVNVAFAREATASSVRDRLGGLTYPVAAARALRSSEPFECTLECDGRTERISAVHVSVSNAPVFGGVLGFRVPGASLTDGLLDVIAVERLSLARLTLAVGDAFVGRHSPVHGVHAMRVRSLRVSADGHEQIAVDGEVIGALPADFEVQPNAVRVVVPQL